jgi:hypothetical protein
LHPHKAPRPAGQFPLFPEIERPVAPLRDFGSGIVPPAVRLEQGPQIFLEDQRKH